MVAGGIVGVAGDFAQRIGRLDRSSDGVGVGLLDLAQGIDLFGDQIGLRADRFGRIVPGTVPRDQRRVGWVEEPAVIPIMKLCGARRRSATPPTR